MQANEVSMRPKLAEDVHLLSSLNKGGSDSWKQALLEQTKIIRLGEELPPEGIFVRDNLRYNCPLKVNFSTAQILVLCDGRRTVAEIQDTVALKLGWTSEQAREAVENVVRFLETNGMIDDFKRRLRRRIFFCILADC